MAFFVHLYNNNFLTSQNLPFPLILIDGFINRGSINLKEEFLTHEKNIDHPPYSARSCYRSN